jgi:beta-galactosidase beta subunit
MIVTSLSTSESYAILGPGISLALQYLRGFDPTTPAGRYPIYGYTAEGAERILHTPTAGLSVATPYIEDQDIEFFLDPPASSSVLLLTGDLAILAPEDAHKPGCMAGGRTEVKKVVVKVQI